MKLARIKFPEKLEPFKGVILFAVVLMASNFLWKYNMMGDEDHTKDTEVMLWGMNVSAPFTFMAHHVAGVCYSILHGLQSAVSLDPIRNIMSYPNHNRVQIIWACTGLKQSFICFCIMAFSRGPWKKKLWYVPLTLLVAYLFNIFRITFIVATIENHPDWFELLHLYIFKYAFYGVIFMMWVLWEEKIAQKPTLKVQENTAQSTD